MSILISHIQTNCFYYLRHLDHSAVIVSFICSLIVFIVLYIIKEKTISFKDIVVIIISPIYISILLAITLLGREELDKDFFFESTSSIQLLLDGNVSVFFDVLFNVLLFIPAGILLSINLRVRPSCIVVLCSTVCIEIIQSIFHRGRFEYIDIVTNLLGGIVGIGLYHLAVVCIKAIRNRMEREKASKLRCNVEQGYTEGGCVELKREEGFFISILADHLARGKTTPCSDCDWKKIADLARIHQVDGIIYHQCKDFMPEDIKGTFEYAYKATLYFYLNRKNAMEEIAKAFDEKGIRFFLLKGLEIAKYYPIPFLRTMGDCDILIQRKDMQCATDALRKIGYKGSNNIHVEHWACDKNGLHFEIHDNVIQEDECTTPSQNRFFNDYDKYIKDGSIDWRFHFLFLLMHLRKHLISGGAGIRQFMDLAVIIKKVPDIDWKWIERQTRKLHIDQFANACFSLIQNWFSIASPINIQPLDNIVINELTEKILKNGVFGFQDTGNQFNRARKMLLVGKSPLWIRRVKKIARDMFPTYEYMRGYPNCQYLEKASFLLPAAWIYRWVYILRGKNNIDSIKTVQHSFAENSDLEAQREFLKKIGL